MPEMTKSTETGSTEKVSLLYIFWVFLKLGATAFGGYMSLVAIVQKQLVEIDKKLKEEDLLDGISLTSVVGEGTTVTLDLHREERIIE